MTKIFAIGAYMQIKRHTFIRCIKCKFVTSYVGILVAVGMVNWSAILRNFAEFQNFYNDEYFDCLKLGF